MKKITKMVKTHKDVEEYINFLKDGTPDRKEEAMEQLIHTGVLTRKGKQKTVIVSWE